MLGSRQSSKAVLNRRERRKVFLQGAPLAAGRKDMEDGADDDAKMPFGRAPKCARASATLD
jgi:hypothetical protein